MASDPSSNNLLYWNNTSPSGSKPEFFFWINFSELSSLSLITRKFQNQPVFVDVTALFHNPSFGNSHEWPSWFSWRPVLWQRLTTGVTILRVESCFNQRLKFLTPRVFRLACHWLGGGEDAGFYSMSWLLSTYCSQIHFQDWVFFKGVTFFLHENRCAQLLLNVNKEWRIALFAFKCL